MDKGNKDQYRKTYSSGSGIKAQNESLWGHAKAYERYGKPEYLHGAPNPPDRHAPQKLGDANNLQGPNYLNRTPDDWRRGVGKGGVESGEGKPNFRRGYHGGK
jgi:hypothetical protein